MSNIGNAVIVVLLYLLTPITGETLFKCQGETVILEFEKVETHHGTSTVSWYMKQNKGRPKLIAYKADKDEPIVQVPFAHYAEIDSNLNLVLRNVSTELNGEYFRRIVNGGIFNSSVNLYVMYAPSGKPVVSKETSGNDKESINLKMSYLGEPKANVTFKPLKMYCTNVSEVIQQYEICLSGRSLQCFEESPCQNFTSRIGQDGIPMQDFEKAQGQDSNMKIESWLKATNDGLTCIDTALVVKRYIHLVIVVTTHCFIVVFLCVKMEESIIKGKFMNGYIVASAFGGALSGLMAATISNRYRLHLGLVLETGFTVLSHILLIIIIISSFAKLSSAETNDGKKKKKQKTTLRTSETADAEGQNFEESEGVVNGMDQISEDETDQNDDVRPGSSNSL